MIATLHSVAAETSPDVVTPAASAPGWRSIRHVFAQAIWAWQEDYAPSMGAALAYYTLFSMTPLLLVVIGIAGAVFGVKAAEGQVFTELQGLIGPDGAKAVQDIVAHASKPQTSWAASIIGLVTLVVGATSVFAELQSSLDRIWRAPAQEQRSGLWALLRGRLLSFGLVVSIGFLLLVSLVFSAAIAALGAWGTRLFPGWEFVIEVLNFAVTFAITGFMFAAIYRVLPSVYISWRDVWAGAWVTALLFTVGKTLIGLYIGKAGVTSTFGAAGSLVVLLLWVYYSAQIFLLGAEFTWIHAGRHGSRISIP